MEKHTQRGHLPDPGPAKGQIGADQDADTENVGSLGSLGVDKVPQSRADKGHKKQAGAGDKAQLGLGGPHEDDVKGQVGQEHLIGQTLQRGTDDRDPPGDLLCLPESENVQI